MKVISISFSCRSREKMKTLIFNILLCADLYLSKISQLTLIFQKGRLVRKSVYSTRINPFHGCIMILKKMKCCVQHVFLKRKKSTWHYHPKRRMLFFQLVVRIERKPWKNLGNTKDYTAI